MRVRRKAVVALLLLGMLALVVGCARQAEEPTIEPKIAPPLIGEAGVLRVGVDLEYPPFAGRDADVEAGIDIEVASAIASKLGLELRTVQVTPAEAAVALADGKVDAVMSVPLTEEVAGEVNIAGVYMMDGPAFFVRSEDALDQEISDAEESQAATPSAETTPSADVAQIVSPHAFSNKRIGAQQGSPSYWALYYDLGEGAVTPYPTIREALQALSAGELDVVAGSAVVSAYVARDFEGVVFAGQYGSPKALGVAVSPENTDLAAEIRGVLDELTQGGVIEMIRSTWAGTLPRLVLP